MFRAFCILIVFCLYPDIAQTQIQTRDSGPFRPLNDYDFSSGDYTLVVIPRRNPGGQDFVLYLRDTVRLNGYKQSWVFKQEAVSYPFACLDGYDLNLLRGGESVAGFQIRLRCEAFVHKGEYWHLDIPGPLFHLMEMDTAWREDTRFDNLASARFALAEARTDDEVIFIPKAEWEDYDGYFFISRPNPNYSGRAPFTEWNRVLSGVQKKLNERCPEHGFDLRLASYGSGKHYKQITFRIASRKEFFEAFDLYPANAWGWQAFKPKLVMWRK